VAVALHWCGVACESGPSRSQTLTSGRMESPTTDGTPAVRNAIQRGGPLDECSGRVWDPLESGEAGRGDANVRAARLREQSDMRPRGFSPVAAVAFPWQGQPAGPGKRVFRRAPPPRGLPPSPCLRQVALKVTQSVSLTAFASKSRKELNKWHVVFRQKTQ
jgi:hypothetical protein